MALAPEHRTSLSDLSCVEDIEGLSVKQLKEILSHNLVNYKDCCEKWELMERVTRLYNDQKDLQNLGESWVLLTCFRATLDWTNEIYSRARFNSRFAYCETRGE